MGRAIIKVESSVLSLGVTPITCSLPVIVSSKPEGTQTGTEKLS